MERVFDASWAGVPAPRFSLFSGGGGSGAARGAVVATVWTGDYRLDGVADFLGIRKGSAYCDSCIATFVQLRLEDVTTATTTAKFLRAPGQCSACGQRKSVVVLAPAIGYVDEAASETCFRRLRKRM